ncbi:HesA/MoeB/ThiF family protein [Simiduia agarivorans]|uniref:Molybdopterin-synthase adenylyltransferase n=1 Tax=Simiduia agarivorans (strain DSM 21679 / JCM 13881 / BCRC 17597 / SA1) TaxID=1117647 RepID=K4KIT2_SIMAS|nr:molybdopterin-synthase adenylyltransferase MoeB [Simiduia agarivorans]AFU99059.1 molybdopterin synthase sulfurylase MoeB [Simiduia agarivorans SA1 = DSM 21679]
MNNDDLLRYSRHLLLDEIDIAGQEKLLAARVLIIGVGGLGSPAALYLASAGVGQLTLCDDDQVELSNLQRQIAHDESRLGQAKAESAAARLRLINSRIKICARTERLQDDSLLQAVAEHDLVLDCTDNLNTRFAINAACHAHKKPLVSGAAIRWDGQISVFNHAAADSACYRCLYHPDAEQSLTCSESGVVAPLVGIVGAMQALEAIKLIVGTGESLTNRLLLLDGKYLQWREIRLVRDPHCPVCSI